MLSGLIARSPIIVHSSIARERPVLIHLINRHAYRLRRINRFNCDDVQKNRLFETKVGIRRVDDDEFIIPVVEQLIRSSGATKIGSFRKTCNGGVFEMESIFNAHDKVVVAGVPHSFGASAPIKILEPNLNGHRLSRVDDRGLGYTLVVGITNRTFGRPLNIFALGVVIRHI